MPDSQKLINLFRNEKAYVHIVGSEWNDYSHWNFLLDQFINLGTDKPRPIKYLEPGIRRDYELDPKSGQYIQRPVSTIRGQGKPNKLTIKAKCCTLAPQDGQIHYYPLQHGVGIVFNSDYCDEKSINKHVYRKNAFSNQRKRLYLARYRCRSDVAFFQGIQFISDEKSTATEKLKAYNRKNRSEGIVAKHTENESVKPQRAALEEHKTESGGLTAPVDNLVTRLNTWDKQLYAKQYVKKHAGWNLDLPISISSPNKPVRAYTPAKQAQDVIRGAFLSTGVANWFATKIWNLIDGVTYIRALTDASAGSLVLDLINAKDFLRATEILNNRTSLAVDRKIDASQKTALHLAVEAGESSLAELLCKKGMSVTKRDAQNNSPLTKAARNANFNLVATLLNNSKILENTADNNDQLAYVLLCLTRAKNFTMAEALLDQYKERNLSALNQKRDIQTNYTVLHYTHPAQPSLTKKLIAAGAEFTLKRNEHSLLTTAAFNQKYDEIRTFLIENPALLANTEENNDQLAYVVYVLVRDSQHQLAKDILAKYSDRNLEVLNQKRHTATNSTALHYAVQQHTPLVKPLIAVGMNIGLSNNNGETPISLALRNENYPLAIEMLVTGYKKLSPAQLQNAVEKLINIEIHRLQIEKFLDDNARNFSPQQAGTLLRRLRFSVIETILIKRDGLEIINTPGNLIDELINRKDWETLHRLLQQQVQFLPAEKNQERLFSLIKAEQYDLANSFAQRHASGTFVEPTTQNTALHLLLTGPVQQNKQGLLKLLCKKGCNVFAKNSAGETPLSMAMQANNIEAVTALLQSSPLHLTTRDIIKHNHFIVEAAEFLKEQGIPLNFLTHLQGDLSAKRRAAIVVIDAYLQLAEDEKEVAKIVNELQGCNLTYLFDRQSGFSLGRYSWAGQKTSTTGTEIMAMAKLRLLQIAKERPAPSLSTDALSFLNEKRSGWSFKSSESASLTLFKSMQQGSERAEKELEKLEAKRTSWKQKMGVVYA